MLACGVCRTDLDVADGDLPNPKLPLVLGHEVVGQVVATGRRGVAPIADFSPILGLATFQSAILLGIKGGRNPRPGLGR